MGYARLEGNVDEDALAALRNTLFQFTGDVDPADKKLNDFPVTYISGGLANPYERRTAMSIGSGTGTSAVSD